MSLLTDIAAGTTVQGSFFNLLAATDVLLLDPDPQRYSVTFSNLSTQQIQIDALDGGILAHRFLLQVGETATYGVKDFGVLPMFSWTGRTAPANADLFVTTVRVPKG